MSVTTPDPLAQAFVRFSVEAGVLRDGEFKTKAGRLSPYCFNAGHFDDGPYAYNRKEAKDHGEGGTLVGAPVRGRVLIIDDVITAGTSVRESVALIAAAGAQACGVAIALDRQERAGDDGAAASASAVQYVRQQFGLEVVAVATLGDLLQYLSVSDDPFRVICVIL